MKEPNEPDEPTLPIRGPGCPAPEQLEQLVTPERDPAVAAHAEGCLHCGPYVTAIREAQGVFQRQRPADQFVRQLSLRAATAQPPRLTPWISWLGLAMAALVALVTVPRAAHVGKHEPLAAPSVTLKGSVLSAVVLRARSPARMESVPFVDDMRLSAGDALRFFYRSPTAGYLALLDLDAKGVPTVLYPPGRGQMAPVEAYRASPLPGSVVLDEVRGGERVFGVFAPVPHATSELVKALAAAPRESLSPALCEGCEVHVLRFQKE